MKSIIAALAIFATQTAALEVTGELERKFVQWASEHNKEYHSLLEFGQRLQHWLKQEMDIQRVNNTPGETVILGHNKFSDWSDEEYKAMLNFEPRSFERSGEPTVLDTSSIPESINWVELGGVNEVVDQGKCGACWAFSAIAALEGQHFAQTKELLKLSEQ